ncbi:mechanosensitive ion channel family protein [Natrarchaeobius chitinivorans]|uniref:Mechanosensitive ion channel family protein n=1 Tax=Natrarchaeobius chitinivorans TaxID=1679083 RepID=A0A3N6MEZ7_NATCH|nr:mechanosensitive ion channel family protein [Natrarchaeobius chitinivorans]
MAISAGTVALALVIGFLVAPFAVRRAVEFADRKLEESEAGTLLETIDEVTGVPFPMRAVVRTLQTVVVGTTGLLLLVVWGYAQLATDVLGATATVLPYAVRLVLTVGLLFGAVVGTRYLEHRLDEWLADAKYVTAHQEGVVFRVLQVTVFVAAGLASLSLWHVELGGLLVGAGFVGIVLGMAARQTLGSLIAGFVLMFSRPFEIGDWVVVGDHEGMVVDITIVNTHLRSFDGETVVLPNDQVSSSTVVNRSKRNRLRLTLEVGVDYETDLEHAESVAVEAIENVDDVAPAPKPQIIPTGFGDSAITLECRFWIRQPNAHKKWTTIRAVVYELKTAFERERIAIPYPQRELSSRANGGFTVEPGERSRSTEDTAGEAELTYDESE